MLVVEEQPPQPTALLPFVGNPRKEIPKGLPFRFADYLEPMDWTGRALREDKRGAIPGNLPPVLERLQIDPRYWLYMEESFESRFKVLVGRLIHSELPVSLSVIAKPCGMS